MKYINECSGECGIYYIRNIINNHIYIGSSIMLSKRYAEHRLKLKTNKHYCTILQNAVNKYGIDNFEFVVIKTFENILDRDLRLIEGMLIRLFKSEYNICKYPEVAGKPNYKRKLSKDWIYNMHKHNNYKHTDNIEMYNRIVTKNKDQSTKVILTIDDIDLPEMSVKDACNYLGLRSHSMINVKQRCHKLSRTTNKKYEYRVTKIQKKRVRVTELNGTVREFESANDCDRFYNLWRGFTSNAITRLNGQLYENHAIYI